MIKPYVSASLHNAPRVLRNTSLRNELALRNENHYVTLIRYVMRLLRDGLALRKDYHYVTPEHQVMTRYLTLRALRDDLITCPHTVM